jgi:hypothetical protein
MAIETCVINKSNLSLSKCLKIPGYIKGMIETPADFVLSESDLATPAALKLALQNLLIAPEGQRGYFFPLSKKTENLSTEAAYEDTPVAVMAVDDGKYAFKLHISENMCLHKAMYSHRATNGRVIFIDKKNQYWLTEVDGGAAGMSFSLLHTEKFMLTDGSGQATTSPVYVVLEDNLEFDAAGLLVDGGTTASQLTRLADVALTVIGSPSATTIVVDVKQSCDGTPVSGLVVADFILLNGSGASQTISSVVESAPGRYTLTGTGWVTGTLNLETPEDLSVLAYESEGAVTITIA